MRASLSASAELVGGASRPRRGAINCRRQLGSVEIPEPAMTGGSPLQFAPSHCPSHLWLSKSRARNAGARQLIGPGILPVTKQTVQRFKCPDLRQLSSFWCRTLVKPTDFEIKSGHKPASTVSHKCVIAPHKWT